jgi:hypothetical protein
MATGHFAQHVWKHGFLDQRDQYRGSSEYQHRLSEVHNSTVNLQSLRTIGNGFELADGANINAMATIGAIRGSADGIQTQIGNLEQDSFSGDSDLNTEVSVLNKINAAGMLTLRTVQDSNKLLASLLEQQTILAKQQRDQTTNAINLDISRDASLASNVAQVTGTITSSLQSFRMP